LSTNQELPELDAESVFLDFDADYFSNTGDYGVSASYNPTSPKLLSKLNYVFTTLLEKNINPTVVTHTESPGYVSPEDWPVIALVFQEIMKMIKKEDYLIGYEHLNKEGRSARSINVRRDLAMHHLIFDFSYIDNRSTFPDDRICFGGDNSELSRALDLMRESFQIDEANLIPILLKMAPFDGLVDNFVDIGWLEYFSGISTSEIEALNQEIVNN
jgi:hypothetical protein